MRSNTILVIDADQFPLQRFFSKEELHQYCVIASSNCADYLIKDGEFFGDKVPRFSESADTYLVLKLQEAIKDNKIKGNKIKEVILASKDKKLLHMLLNTIWWLDNKIVIKAHALCPEYIEDCVHNAYACYATSPPKSKTPPMPTTSKCNKKTELIKHLSKYNLGLKLGTLSDHFSMPREAMLKHLKPLLINRDIIYCQNVYKKNYLC